MSARMHWVFGLARRVFGRVQTPAHVTRKGRDLHRLALESLERREVLSGVVTAPFASLPGTISTPGQRVHVQVQLAPGQATFSKGGSYYIGLDAEPAPGSSVQPWISEVINSSGPQFAVNSYTGGRYIIKVNAPAGSLKSFGVDVVGQGTSVGNFVLDAFLPGDVDGNGAVNQDDLNRIQSAYGTREGQSGYDAAADINQDGRVGCLDRRIARANLGAEAKVVPEWKAPAIVTPPQAAPTVVAGSIAARSVVPTPVPIPVTMPVPAQPVVATSLSSPAIPPLLVYYQPVGVMPVYSQPVQAVNYVPAVQAVPVAAPVVPQVQAPPYSARFGLIPVSDDQTAAQSPTFLFGPPGSQNATYVYGQAGVSGPLAAQSQGR